MCCTGRSAAKISVVYQLLILNPLKCFTSMKLGGFQEFKQHIVTFSDSSFGSLKGNFFFNLITLKHLLLIDIFQIGSVLNENSALQCNPTGQLCTLDFCRLNEIVVIQIVIKKCL